MEKFYSDKTPVRATLAQMEVGDIVRFPVRRLSVVRSTTSNLGYELDRKYTTKHNREEKTVDVTRTE